VELEMRELVRRDASGGYVRASSPRGA
jgi:hypothetical protein